MQPFAKLIGEVRPGTPRSPTLAGGRLPPLGADERKAKGVAKKPRTLAEAVRGPAYNWQWDVASG